MVVFVTVSAPLVWADNISFADFNSLGIALSCHSTKFSRTIGLEASSPGNAVATGNWNPKGPSPTDFIYEFITLLSN